MIKKLTAVYVLVLLLAGFSATAQIHQYSVMVGGDITGRYWRGSLPGPGQVEIKFTNVEVNASPRAGVFLWQQFALGLGVDYNYFNRIYKKSEFNDRPDIKELEWTAGPFARFYFLNRIFAEGFAGLGIRNVNDQERTDVLRGTAGLGYALFVNERIAVEPVIKYAHYSREITQSIREKRNGVELTVGLQIYLFHDKMILYK